MKFARAFLDVVLGLMPLISFYLIGYANAHKMFEDMLLLRYAIVAFGGVCFMLWLNYKCSIKDKEKECEHLKLSLKRDYTIKHRELEDKYAAKCRKVEQAEREAEKLQKEAKRMQHEAERYVLLQNSIMKDTSPFRYVAELCADWDAAVYERTIHYLRTKNRPAPKRAEEVKVLKMKTKESIRNYKEMRYKYLFLLDVFPELKQYVDDEEALIQLADYNDYEDFKSERDEVLEFISTEEYKALSEDERNQLALDRYKKSSLSNKEIGFLYEMYIGHLLRKSNMRVIQYGIKNGLQDLGRDIIATRMEDGVEVTYIIQCKNWSKEKEVHENVVCQLFGTAVQYKITHEGVFSKVVPMLVITNKLSPVAEKFAKYLGVVVAVRPLLKDFPMIKCNINQGNKIYHLPFDQQYKRTQIDSPGEFYALTVKEASDAGFRRARRHIFNKE